MIKIMFVCHGNICRSPMAEFVFKQLAEDAGLSEAFVIRSAATSTEEIGNPIYPPAKAELRRRGVPFNERNAVQISRADYNMYDLLVAMDDRNIHNMHRMLGGDPDGKIRKLMDFTDRPGDVSDPWYTGRFDEAYNDIREGCERLFFFLTKK